MIVNVPTSENMNKLALRLYFGAWADLVNMETQFDLVFEPSGIDWSAERAEYFVYCQPELQAICTVIQQSNELALKARICHISPYLLLLNSGPALSAKPKDIDFATLRTLDAVDLPAAVNSLCTEKLSDGFIQAYNQIRSYRNQIAHLGETAKEFRPSELLHTLVAQYREIWPTRHWLQDRVEFAEQTTAAFFHDGRYGSAHATVMEELEGTFSVLTGAEFKALFGHAKTKRRYYCFDCVYNGQTKGYYPGDYDHCKTAFVSEDGQFLHCAMCGQDTQITRIHCASDGCKSNVIAASGEHEGSCHMCLKPQVPSEVSSDTEFSEFF